MTPKPQAKPPAAPTEQELVTKLHKQLLDVASTLEEAAQQGFVIDFGINTDLVTKKAALTALQVRRSYL